MFSINGGIMHGQQLFTVNLKGLCITAANRPRPWPVEAFNDQSRYVVMAMMKLAWPVERQSA